MPFLADRRARVALDYAGVAVAVFAVATLSLLLTRETHRLAAAWPANAIVLAALLRSNPRRWPAFLASGFLGCLISSLALASSLRVSGGLAVVNQGEVLLCALACRAYAGRVIDLRRPKHLGVFIAAVLAATVASGLAAASFLFLMGGHFQPTLKAWVPADALGLLIVTPALLTAATGVTRRVLADLAGPRGLVALGLLGMTLAIVFLQTSYSLLFMVLPAVVVCAFLVRPATLAVMLLATAMAAIGATAAGTGPVSVSGADFRSKMLVLQLFLAATTVCALALSAVIFDLKRALERIQHAETEIRHLVEHSADVVIRVEPERGITWISPSCRRLGYEPEDLLGKQANDLVHPEDIADVEALRDARFAGDMFPPGFGRRFRMRTATGDWVWFEGNPALLPGGDGRPAAIVNTLRDITVTRAMEEQLRESEQQYRLLAEGSTDIITTFGLDARFTYVSPSMKAVLGYEPDELIGGSTRQIMHADDYKRSLQRYGAHMRSANPHEPFHFVYRAIHKDGHEVWMEGHPRPIVSADGEVIGFHDTARDITDRKALELALSRARDEAEAAAAAKGAFVANMSHEIRTPLTAILGFTSLLNARGDLPAEAAGQVGRIATAGQALLALVNDVLDFAKLEAGQIALREAPASLDEVLADALALFEPSADAKGLALKLETDGPLPIASIDADRLRQVLLNLVGNAVKFTEAGDVTVHAEYDETREVLRIAVSDSGPGIDEAGQALLFQRFSQIDGSSTRRHGGTGLGLAICRGLVEVMGGEISVSSRPGEGSTFRFSVSAPVCAAPEPVETESICDLFGLRVLVVDDNPVNRELVRAILGSLGAEVSEADDGDVAVEVAMVEPFDVILMDIRMPRLSGPDAVLQIRGRPGPNDRAPIIAFSADYDLERFGDQGRRGFDDHVRKPIKGMDLLAAIARAVAWDGAMSQEMGRSA